MCIPMKQGGNEIDVIYSENLNRLPAALTMINSKHVFTKRVYDSYHNLYIEEDWLEK